MGLRTSLQCISCITVSIIVVASALSHETDWLASILLCGSLIFVKNVTDVEGAVRVEDPSSASRRWQKVVVKRNIEQIERYRDKDPEMLEFAPPCGHEERRLKCCTIPV